MTKLIFIVPYFFPISKGGTEIYVYNLAISIAKYKFNVIILTPDQFEKSIDYEGLKIETFIRNDLNSFRGKIINLQPDIIHFHGLNNDITSIYVKLVYDELKIFPFLSLHLYNSICLRNGEFVYKGLLPCNGRISPLKCYLCLSKDSFWKKYLKSILLFFKITHKYSLKPFSNILSDIQNIKKYAKLTAFNLRQKTILRTNGIDSVIIPHAIINFRKKNVTYKKSEKLIIGFVGRISEEKGLHILIDALSKVETTSIKLLVLGMINDEKDIYYTDIRKKIDNCAVEIDFKLNLDNDNFNTQFHKINLLCVPSLVTEVGPMVVLEGLSRGIPILASHFSSNYLLHGINGLVYHDFNNLVFYLNKISSDFNFLTNFSNCKTDLYSFDQISEKHRKIYLA